MFVKQKFPYAKGYLVEAPENWSTREPKNFKGLWNPVQAKVKANLIAVESVLRKMFP